MRSGSPSETGSGWHAGSVLSLLLGLAVLGAVLGGCGGDGSPAGVQSHLSGRIQVDARIDSSADFGGFRVLVAQGRGRQVDTLGYAVTERDGRFATDVRASERGVYPLVIWGRAGRDRLLTTEYVVAAGDSATLELTFPLTRRLVRIQSPENAALLAYRNTMALHRQNLVRRIQQANYQETYMLQSIRQTSSILWGLKDTYPGTFAAELGAVESLALLEGWNDSLVVARAGKIRTDNPRFVEAARIGRRSVARLHGQSAALQLIEDFHARATTDAQRAALRAVQVRTHLDSLEQDAALDVATALQREFPGTRWARWADRAAYEAEHLLPGMPAPNVQMRTVDGRALSLDSLRGRVVLLEFYRPGDDLFKQQIPTRNALYRATRADSVAFVSVSVEPDSILNRAFFEGRVLPGRHVIAPNGLQDSLAVRYNVGVVPTRFLIDASGTIVDKYAGFALLSLQDDLQLLLDGGSVLSTPTARRE